MSKLHKNFKVNDSGLMSVGENAPNWLTDRVNKLCDGLNIYQSDFVVRETKRMCKLIDKYYLDLDGMDANDLALECQDNNKKVHTDVDYGHWFVMMVGTKGFKESENDCDYYNNEYTISGYINSVKQCYNYNIYKNIAEAFLLSE